MKSCIGGVGLRYNLTKGETEYFEMVWLNESISDVSLARKLHRCEEERPTVGLRSTPTVK